jgi:anthranilate phosphoribosyltransferase
VQEAIERVGLGFLFAPRFHPAMRHAVGPRREIGIRTVFNVLGPLTNPAGARRQVIGVYDPRLVEPLALVARELGAEHTYVVHGDGLDELTTTGPTRVAEVREGRVRTFELEPEQVGLPRASPEALRGGDARYNAQGVERILNGERGPWRDVVLLNAAAALVAAGTAEDFREGIVRAAEAVDSGAAAAKLTALRAYFGAGGEG